MKEKKIKVKIRGANRPRYFPASDCRKGTSSPESTKEYVRKFCLMNGLIL